MKKRYRIKSRLRFFFSFMIVLFLLLSIGASVAGSSKYEVKNETVQTLVKVQAGDTLWDIAKMYGPTGKDIRRIVHKICVLNDISPEELQPGQEIAVPARI